MSTVSSYPAGTFCWIDLTTSEVEKAKAFYTGLFGWEAEDIPVSDTYTYSQMNLNGRAAAAIAPPPPGMAASGAPSMWGSYVAVDDVDATTETARELGAKILSDPMDVMGYGRMSTVADPSGGTLMLWQAKTHIGAGVVNEPGSLVWNELLTTDVEAAAAFYTKLFGWTLSVDKMPDGRDYHMFENNGRPCAGMMAITPEMGPMPSAWMIYFAVANLDESLAKAEELGGTKVFGPMDLPGTGRFALISDSVGGHSYIMQMEQEPTPIW